jgi:anti-anti-sigma factor
MASSDTQEFSDNSMLELFRAEVEIHTQTLNEGLLALEKEPGQLHLIESLMRAAHSIKGAARIVGIQDGVRVSHVMEDCLVAAQNEEVFLTSDAIDVLLAGVDALVRIASPNQVAPDATAVEKLLQDISQIRQGKPRAAKKPPPDQQVSREARLEDPQPVVTPGITVVTSGNVRILSLPGNLDAMAADRLRSVLVEQVDAGAREFRLDLSAVHQVEMEGLALLKVFANTVRRHARQAVLEVIHVENDVATLFRMTGLAGLYRLEGAGS